MHKSKNKRPFDWKLLSIVSLVFAVVFLISTIVIDYSLNQTIIVLKSQISEMDAKLTEAEPYFKLSELEQQRVKETLAIDSIKKLGSGNFVSGQDFLPGVYNIRAIKGNGNVMSDNAYSGGINAVMGPQNDGFYVSEYNNISLPEGTTLTVDGLTIQLTPTKFY